MPRDLPLSNGCLLVNFDQYYQMRDLYWPHVGQENHTTGHPFRFGVWLADKFSWVHQEGWTRSLKYSPATMVSQVVLENKQFAIRLECQDAVDFHENLYLRQITLVNLSEQACSVRLFFGQDFYINETEVGDSAYYEPERRAILHYKEKTWFLINTGKFIENRFVDGVDEWAIGIKEMPGLEGTWRDAEDGKLSGNAVAQGSVDSCLALHLEVPAQGQTISWYWIAVGEDFQEVTRINRAVRQRGITTFLERTRNYWALWASKEQDDFLDLPAGLVDLYRHSLLIIRTQIDEDGAIIAANDYDITRYSRDTYSYMWPRDGALVAASLIAAGYSEPCQSFFNFCHQVITPEGYLLHKYNPDGSLASSWHAWYQDGIKQLPVQEDETALVLWALWRHFQRFRGVEFIKPLYRGLIVRAANWLVSYRDATDGLPLPSWDLWEERRGILAWTVSATWAGLHAAANFSIAFGEVELANQYRKTADEIRAGAETYLWRSELGRFVRMINHTNEGEWEIDAELDSSLFGLWYFGMFAADDPRIVVTIQAIREKLTVKTVVGGVARYENDRYQQISSDKTLVPGNPWFICTLWLAQWYIAIAKSIDDLRPAKEILNWTASHALSSGVMAEQVHPFTDAPLSVSPLTWSHATYVLAVLEYLKKRLTFKE
jgi:glucoamylase